MSKQKEYNNDKLFTVIRDKNYKLKWNDRMRRLGYASSHDWFPIAKFDVGQKAGYFWGSTFQVERRKRKRNIGKPSR
jgi:hypothetical protein